MDWAHRPQVPGREGADLPQGPRGIPALGWLQEVMSGSWGSQQGLWGAGWGADPQLLLGTSLEAPACGLLSSPAGATWASSCPPIPVWGLLRYRTPSPRPRPQPLRMAAPPGPLGPVPWPSPGVGRASFLATQQALLVSPSPGADTAQAPTLSACRLFLGAWRPGLGLRWGGVLPGPLGDGHLAQHCVRCPEALRHPLQQCCGVTGTAVQHHERPVRPLLVQGDGGPASEGEPPSPVPRGAASGSHTGVCSQPVRRPTVL